VWRARAGDRGVIDARRPQRTFGDGFVADAVVDLQEPWMCHADAILDDDILLATVDEALARRHPNSRTRGRHAAPAEMVLRLLVLKHVRNWSYAAVEREIRGNLVYRHFTRIGGGKVPDAKTMGRWGVALGPSVNRWHAIRLQDASNRRPTDTMPDVLQRAANPRVAPRRVLLRHAHNQPPDLRKHARTNTSSFAVGPFPRDQLSMPSEDRVRSDDRRDLALHASAQSVPTNGEPTPLVIAEPKTPALELLPQDAILHNQVRHGLLLASIQPADQRREQHAEKKCVDHGGTVHRANRANVARFR
jgi:hypothetical protein